MKVINLTLNSDKNIRYVFSLTDGDDIEKRTAHYLQVETYTQQNLTGHLPGLCFQSFIKLFSLYQKRGEITMSKENAEKFLKLINEDHKLSEEAKKCIEGGKISCETLSKLAKENKLECSSKELEEAMDSMTSQQDSGELDDSDLESVAGGIGLGAIFALWKLIRR